MTPAIILIAVFIYLIALFGIAKWGDKKQFTESSWIRHPIVYSLALGVYCTSWTFYGLVGTASEKGWNFFPILLGPILLFTLGFPILERIYTITRQENIHSIADFIASRYGKRQGVAATVSVVVLLATIPYIALQLKAVSDTLLLTVGRDFLVSQDLTFVIGLSMIAFALAFGAKRLDMSGYHSGLMSAIAFESIVKLLVLMAVAVFAWFYISEVTSVASDLTLQIDADDSTSTPIGHTESFGEAMPSVFFQALTWPRFLVETLLSICAVFCLPRMFHVTFVECLSKNHLQQSRWLFVIYLVLITFCIVLIASVGNQIFINNPGVSGDAYVIALPLQHGQSWLAMLAFMGGFSAATAMIIVATITLSQMLSNDVILPLLMRRQKHKNIRSDFSKSLIFSRRLTVIGVVLGAYFYQSTLAENAALTSIGLIAFALVVQLAPAILFGLYWRKGNAQGLYAGLIVGVSLWFYMLMVPLLVKSGVLDSAIINDGLFTIDWLRPEYLFGFTFSDAFTRGVLVSLAANILFYLWYSVTSVENLADKIQSAAFTRLVKGKYDHYQDIDIHDLQSLLVEFLGLSATNKLLMSFDIKKNPQAKHQLVEAAQQSLAAIVGVASSQSMIESLYSGKKIAVEEVVDLFGKTAQAFKFNQEVLSASFENISSGISVVDNNLCLIAWNQRYEDMFQYPEGFLKIGLHVSDIMRFNGERGLLGKGNVDQSIRKRLSFMAAGKIYRVVRFHQEGVVIEIKGRPLPNGGYVTTYDDITEFIETQRNLEDANANLEQRVRERTHEIEEVNTNLLKEIKLRIKIEEALLDAKQMADAANASKTKFLALASHDIMQPLNAANLYASALLGNDGQLKQEPNIVKQLQSAIANTESIISTLLEVSKVDSGIILPKMTEFDLHAMLDNIITEARVQLPQSIELLYCKTSVSVLSDRHYLHRIVQNFVSNAIKYTQEGKVLVGCRRVTNEHGEKCVEICVLDNGMGISDNEKAAIFDDFYRINAHQPSHNIPGVGLGLSVVSRFSELLGHSVNCQSQLHRGSCFSVTVPLASALVAQPVSPQSVTEFNSLEGMEIIYVDDEAHNLRATSLLVDRWGCTIIPLNSIAEARDYVTNNGPAHLLLMDYQLDRTDISGISLAQEFVDYWRREAGADVPVCIISAATETHLPKVAKQAGFQFLRKPVKPGRLRALLTQLYAPKASE